MNRRDELELIRRRQSDDVQSPERAYSRPTTGWRSYVGKVVRDDRFWPYSSGYGTLGGVTHVPAPPYVAMTRPLDYDPAGAEGSIATATEADDLIPVLCMNEVPIDGTLVLARNWDGWWATDDAFGGYYQIFIVGYCGTVVGPAEVTIEDLAAPFGTQSGVWDGTGGAYGLSLLSIDPAATGGSFTLGPFGTPFGVTPAWETDPIASDASAAAVEAALLAAGRTVTCYDGPLPGTPIVMRGAGIGPALQVISSNLTGGTNCVQRASVGPFATGGTRTLTLSGRTTDPIPWDATAEQLQAAIGKLSSVGPANVRVSEHASGLPPGRYLVEFIGDRGAQSIATMTASAAGLTGPSPTATVTLLRAGARAVASVGVVPVLDSGGRYYDETKVLVFPYRTRGPHRITVHSPDASWDDFTLDELPPAGLDRLTIEVNRIPGKICSCFGQVNPTIALSTPFGDVELAPQYDVAGDFLDRWAFEGAVTISGNEACYVSLNNYVKRNTTFLDGPAWLRFTLICGSPPSLQIDFAATGFAGITPLIPVIWTTYMAGACNAFGGGNVPVPSVDQMPLNHTAGGAYLGTLPVPLPVSASFSVSTPTFLAGTYTADEV